MRLHSHWINTVTVPNSLFKSSPSSPSSGQSFSASSRLYSVVGASILRFSSTATLSLLELPRQDRGDSTVELCLFDGELEALHRLRLRFHVSKWIVSSGAGPHAKTTMVFSKGSTRPIFSGLSGGVAYLFIMGFPLFSSSDSCV